MKNWFTYSTQSISKSRLATTGKSRLSIFPALSARWNDHSASEILNKGSLFSPASAASTAACGLAPTPIAAPATAVLRKKERRSSEPLIEEPSQEYLIFARSIDLPNAGRKSI